MDEKTIPKRLFGREAVYRRVFFTLPPFSSLRMSPADFANFLTNDDRRVH